MRTVDLSHEPSAVVRLVHRDIAKEGVPERVVRSILKDVQRRGDRALLEYTRKFDCPRIDDIGLRVSPREIRSAYGAVSRPFLRSLRLAKRNITEYHARQNPGPVRLNRGGLRVTQHYLPLERVGMYVPGGKAAYPSTVLMNAIPASVAGVREIVMTTPCNPSGQIAAEVLVAAGECGVSEIYRVGGAQAVAALAYGTGTIRRVDKITGPGNIYVATAKRLVFGVTGIDALAGPTEVLIIADERARPELVAADLIAQAEHDEQALAVCVSPSARILRQVGRALEKQLRSAPRRKIARRSLGKRGLLIRVSSLTEAAEVANSLSPEHCELHVRNPRRFSEKITAAGAVFVGEWATEALGDYVAGPNHTLPTSGTARFSSALSTLDFMRFSTTLECSRREFLTLAPAVEVLAEAEGLYGHAASVRIRRTLH